jgi:hypothetical protein
LWRGGQITPHFYYGLVSQYNIQLKDNYMYDIINKLFPEPLQEVRRIGGRKYKPPRIICGGVGEQPNQNVYLEGSDPNVVSEGQDQYDKRKILKPLQYAFSRVQSDDQSNDQSQKAQRIQHAKPQPIKTEYAALFDVDRKSLENRTDEILISLVQQGNKSIQHARGHHDFIFRQYGLNV